ncbi:hypothetical protein FJT64_004306 [Amphibalanus amphitrite]|uniref:Uncharacterized protein n=1 Tax=Amphibalanus amphitrite TaxID=1232801 RepID=A0A6A4W895_AMPAM|nr:hypothetical protein FJT64_004306 [Amphibalanus amphitrite]
MAAAAAAAAEARAEAARVEVSRAEEARVEVARAEEARAVVEAVAKEAREVVARAVVEAVAKEAREHQKTPRLPETTTTPTTTTDTDLETTTPPADEDTSTVYPTNEIVIPDVATLEVFSSNGSIFNAASRSRWPKGRRRAARRRGGHPIYINGTALSGNQLCNIAFNVSGVFQLNRTMSARTTTVIITQLISTSPPERMVGLLAENAGDLAQAASADLSHHGWGIGSREVRTGTGRGRHLGWGGAVDHPDRTGCLRRVRAAGGNRCDFDPQHRRNAALLDSGIRGYGTIEGPEDTWRYYNSFE